MKMDDFKYIKDEDTIHFYKSDAYNYRDTECYNEMLKHNIIMEGYIPIYFDYVFVFFGREDDGHIWFNLNEDYKLPMDVIFGFLGSLAKVADICYRGEYSVKGIYGK